MKLHFAILTALTGLTIASAAYADPPNSAIFEVPFTPDEQALYDKNLIMELYEPTEGQSMAESHYSPAQAEQFLFAEGWDKYHDRFFTRGYVQEGLDAYSKARRKGE